MIRRGVVGAFLVLAGGFVTTPLPRSLGADLVAPLAHVGSTMEGRMVGLALNVLGLALLSWAWLTLVKACSRGHDGVDVATVRRATWAWSLPLLPAAPLFSRDGFSYIAQAELTRRLLSPYTFAPDMLSGVWNERVDPRWLSTVTPYGPVPLVWGAVCTTLTRDPSVAIVLERCSSLLGIALLLWAIPHLARWCGRDGATVTALVVASPLMIAHGVGGLHNDVLLAGLAAAGLALAGRGQWGWGAVLVGLAAAVKVPAGMVAVGIVLVSLRADATLRARLTRALAVAAVAVATLVAAGIPYHLGVGWVSALAVPGEVLTPFSVSSTVGRVIGWAAERLGADDVWATCLTVARTIGMALAVLVGAAVALRVRTGDRAAALAGLAVTMLAVLLLSPVVHAWYALWVIPFVAPLRLGQRRLRVLLAVSVVAGISAPLDSSLEGAIPATVLTTAMVLAVVVPLLVRTGPVASAARLTPAEHADADRVAAGLVA
ncbi:polyprenol phosphomannose-dependent alpha 1,6 mannosyltransferase MptB [Arsenicicoccus dermatophilus]|uniref:polyprenol phosphomannose-dependent alpha 1,6 mannosyltransferase MptB n=1 Tax=Arsenicicoccus dermatophilus TaxID=1076331 RepID=UPI0039170512